jgi:hypothetical protein
VEVIAKVTTAGVPDWYSLLFEDGRFIHGHCTNNVTGVYLDLYLHEAAEVWKKVRLRSITETNDKLVFYSEYVELLYSLRGGTPLVLETSVMGDVRAYVQGTAISVLEALQLHMRAPSLLFHDGKANTANDVKAYLDKHGIRYIDNTHIKQKKRHTLASRGDRC